MTAAEPATESPPEAHVHRTLWILFSIVFLNLAGFGLMIPLLPFYGKSLPAPLFGIGLPAPEWLVAILFAAYSAGQFFAEPIWGRLSDWLGRKPVLVATIACNVLGYIALANVQTLEQAILIRFFTGLGAGNISAIQGYVADVSPPEKRAGRMGFLGAAFGLGFVIGPGGGMVFGHGVDQAGLRLLLYGSAALCAASCLGVLLFVKESRRKGAPSARRPSFFAGLAEARRHPVIRRVVLVTLTYMGAFAGMESTFGFWTAHRYKWTAFDLSLAFVIVGLVSAITQGLVTGRLARLFTEARVLTVGILLFGASLTTQVLLHDPRLVVVIMGFGTFGMALSMPNISALISRSTTPDTQGGVLGVNMAAASSARIVGPILAGQLFSHIGPDAPFVVGACLTLPAAILAMDAGSAFRRAQAAPVEP
jgi:MFS family permease